MGPIRLEEADDHWLHLVGRLAPGVRASQAISRHRPCSPAMLDREPAAKAASHRGVLTPISVTPPGDRGWMTTLLGGLMLIVALTLVVACANVTNLLLGLAVSRRHEMVVRAALGASRLQLALPLVREGAMLGLAGGLVGCGAAWARPRKTRDAGLFAELVHAGVLARHPTARGRVDRVRWPSRSRAGAAASTLPALRSAAEGAEGLIQRAVPSTRRHARARRVLVAVQMIVCTIVLAALGLAAHSLFNLRHIPLGFQARDLVYRGHRRHANRAFDEAHAPAFLSPRARLDDGHARRRRGGDRERRPARGVDDSANRLVASDRPRRRRFDVPSLVVDDHYFATIEMPLVAGRSFDGRDRAGSARGRGRQLDAGAPDVAWAGCRRTITCAWAMTIGSSRSSASCRTASTATSTRRRRRCSICRSRSTTCRRSRLIARTRRQPLRGERTTCSKLAPAPAIGAGAFFTLNDMLQLSMALPRAIVWAAVVLGAVALALTMFALYSTVFYSVSQRRAEIGIRTALGATPAQLFRLVLGESGRVAAVGAALGLVAASLLTPVAATIFVGIGAIDPAVLAGVAIVCAVTTVVITLVVVRPWTRLPASVLLRP